MLFVCLIIKVACDESIAGQQQMQIHIWFSVAGFSALRHNKAAFCELSQFVCGSHHVRPFSFISVWYPAVEGGVSRWAVGTELLPHYIAELDSSDGYHLTEATKNKGWCSQHGGIKNPLLLQHEVMQTAFYCWCHPANVFPLEINKKLNVTLAVVNS